MSRELPAKPHLEHLKKQARRRLREVRRETPGAQLAMAQREVANSYGYTSWAALKASVEASRNQTAPGVVDVSLADVSGAPVDPKDSTRLVGIDVRQARSGTPIAVALLVPLTRFALLLLDGSDRAVEQTLTPSAWRAIARWTVRCDSMTPPTRLPLEPAVVDELMGRSSRETEAYRFVSFPVPSRFAREGLQEASIPMLSRLRRDWRPDLTRTGD